MGCRGWPGLETQESQAWETRLVSNPERSHLHQTLRWERTLPPPVSFHFLEGWGDKGAAQQLKLI